tara:strand:- start:4645 stop:6285 length:1641 start_codon:yes stop_codon:yes gene_type:complete
MIKNIVVVGGGFAGYFTALTVHDIFYKWYTNFNITVIESSKLGTIGVGESTAQNVPSSLATLGIDPYQFMKESKATFKMSARFDNWNYEGEQYHHPLIPVSNLIELNVKFDRQAKPVVIDPYIQKGLDIIYMQGTNKEWAEIGFDNLIKANKVPFRATGNEKKPYEIINLTTSDNSRQHTSMESILGFHMDANLSAQFLQKKCKQRGITIIDGKVGDWTLDSDTGYLNEVVTDQGDKIQGDFFFDCTGFRRLIIGDIFKEKWIDWSHEIPQNNVSIINGGVKYKEGEGPELFTKLDAQKHGWMFKIPLQHRIGSGYVYSDKFVDKETIHKEQIEHWNAQGYDVEIGKQLSWSAGKYERSLVKNCLAVGLSEGFVDALDGNALILSLSLLQEFAPMFDRHMIFDSIDYKDYNKKALDAYEHTKNYIYFAHLQKREDSEYWKFFKEDKNIPEWLQEKLWLWAHRPPRGHEELTQNHRPFGIGSFCTVGMKSGLSGGHVSKRDLIEMDLEKEGKMVYDICQEVKNQIIEHSVDHKDILEWINTRTDYLS